MSKVSESDVSSLGSIMQGFSKTDLENLVISSNTMLSNLGALDKWSTDQVFNFILITDYYIYNM